MLRGGLSYMKKALPCVRIQTALLKRFLFHLLILIPLASGAQKLELKAGADTPSGQKTIDSLSYIKKHENLKSLYAEAEVLSGKLTQAGYIENELTGNERASDSLFVLTFRLGERTKSLLIYIGVDVREKTKGILSWNETEEIAFADAEARLQLWIATMESNGYPLARLQLRNFRKEGRQLAADLTLDTGNRRNVGDIVINGYDKFPEGHKANIRRMYRKRVFNKENLKSIKNEFDKFRFVTQTKYPEILFTKDTTKVYVYLEKAKPNKFEGFLGFSNDEEKDVRFNGYLDLLLVNLLNSGEEFSLYWKSDGKEQRTFNAALELPYVFRSRIGLKMALNIFRQDSTFQTTRTSLEAGYLFRYNTRAYLGYQSSESSDIQNQNTAVLSDFENRFITASFDYFDYVPSDFLFPERTRIQLKMGTGSRESKFQDDRQFFVSLDARHSFYLNEKNSIFLRTQDYYLGSGHYITNELFRFGGINSIRGFNENSLQGNLMTSLLTEYRYAVAPSLYVYTLLDYGYFRDETSEITDKLLGIGFGAGILTRNGLLNIVYANGTVNRQEIRLSNSIVHISFKTNF